MDFWSGLFGIGGDLLSGAASAKGANIAFERSRDMAREQMAFQERMSNTAHQREVADLRAANLNPVLSARYGGASTPTGAMGSVENPLANFKIRGLESASAMTQNQYTKEMTRGAKADADIKEQEADIRTSTGGKWLNWVKLISDSVGGLVSTAALATAPGRAVKIADMMSNSARGARITNVTGRRR